MPREWKSGYFNRLRSRKSERGRQMADRRWELQRQRQKTQAELTAEQCQNAIVRRIIVIDRETRVREATFFAFDSDAMARRKLREILAA
jgi:murein L,D-transpeptidase YafK